MLDVKERDTDAVLHWKEIVAPYRQPSPKLSTWKFANTVSAFFLVCILMFIAQSYSYWLTLALAPLAAGFHIRIFTIAHDCGHGAFFKTQKTNDIVGTICSFLCLTPYYHWRHFHAVHHATVGNLDRRIDGELLPLSSKKYTQNNGDVLTLTVREYQQLSAKEKMFYRVYRNPFLLFLVMPLILFVVVHRFSNPRATGKERASVYWTNLALLVSFLGLGFAFGFVPLLLTLLPIKYISATIGVWLFYVQHQYEATYWEPNKEWDFAEACLQGSSYYKLPRVLAWFSGNIGYHHIHHLSPRIPFYYLPKCHNSNPLFQESKVLTAAQPLKTLHLRLWDEEQKKMVGYKAAKK
jgi:acyl-lipid omega-6 desaturase (Delta-12 desaturase)